MWNGDSSSSGKLRRSPTTVRAAASVPSRCGRRRATSAGSAPLQARWRDTVGAAAVRGSTSAMAWYMPSTAAAGARTRNGVCSVARQCAAGGSHSASAARWCRSDSSSGEIVHVSRPAGEMAGCRRPRAISSSADRATRPQARNDGDAPRSSGRAETSSSSNSSMPASVAGTLRRPTPSGPGNARATWSTAHQPGGSSSSVSLHNASREARPGSPGTNVACSACLSMGHEPTRSGATAVPGSRTPPSAPVGTVGAGKPGAGASAARR